MLMALAGSASFYEARGWCVIKNLELGLREWVKGGKVEGGMGWGNYRARWMMRLSIERDE
jgi:hypothetical protein